MSSNNPAPLSPMGLLAGSGVFPKMIIEALRGRGQRSIAVAYLGEADQEIGTLADECTWIKVGELGQALKTFKRAGVRQVLFAGGIRKAKAFSDFKLDLKGALFLARVRSFNDDVLLRALADEFESNGIEIMAANSVLNDSVPKVGLVGDRGLSRSERKEAELGWKAAKKLGEVDVGQTVVVNRNAVVAVEAVEGTDATIKRAGELTGVGAVVVKVSKPQQDLRFDLPSIGPTTIEMMRSIGATALVIEAGKTILLEKEKIVANANQFGIAIEAWE